MIIGYIIRHAEYLGNLDTTRMWGESLTMPLTENGREQAIALHNWTTKEFENTDVSIFTSQAKRTQETARIAFLNKIEPSQFTIDSRLNETSRGDYEGRPISDIPQKYTTEYRKNPFFAPFPTGESYHDSGKRWLAGIQDIFSHESQNTRVVIFTHANVLKSGLFYHLWNKSPEEVLHFNFPNTGIVKVCYQNNEFQTEHKPLDQYNFTPHLS